MRWILGLGCEMTLLYLYLCVSFITGVYAGSLYDWPLELFLLAGLLPAAVAFLWRRTPAVRLLALCLLAVLLGAARYQMAAPRVGPEDVA